jgi:Kef-type K+ transport system membrane component KefB
VPFTVTESTGRILLDVAVILLAARAGGLLFARAGQPAVIGEIAAGVALGPTLLGALPGDPSSDLFPPGTVDVLRLIGQLGLVLFMFGVGWDLDLQLVRRREGAALTVSVGSTLLPFALGLGLAVYLHPDHDTVAGEAVPFWPFALFVGASLALTAFPVLARILRESGLAATPLGALTLAAADDEIGWSVVAVALAALASSGPWDYVRIALESALFVVVAVVVVRPLLHTLLRDPSPAREAVVLPAALAGAYVTEAIGIHAVFGAFLIGTVMPRRADVPALERLGRQLSGAVAVLAPIYFVLSGLLIDIPALRANDLAAFAVIMAAACAGKVLGAYGGARAAGIARRDSVALGVLMNTRGLIEIVLLTVGRDARLIDDRLFTLLALMAIATTLLTSPVLRRIGPRMRDPVPA